jgi:hypothetical protein
MARRPNTTPDGFSPARLRWLYTQGRRSRDAYKLAIASKSYQAAASFLREERAIRDQVDEQLRLKTETTTKPERQMTTEERAEALAGLVASASIAELEVTVAEYMRRHRYRLMIDDCGALQVVPLGEDTGGLRLVQ